MWGPKRLTHEVCVKARSKWVKSRVGISSSRRSPHLNLWLLQLGRGFVTEMWGQLFRMAHCQWLLRQNRQMKQKEREDSQISSRHARSPSHRSPTRGVNSWGPLTRVLTLPAAAFRRIGTGQPRGAPRQRRDVTSSRPAPPRQPDAAFQRREGVVSTCARGSPVAGPEEPPPTTVMSARGAHIAMVESPPIVNAGCVAWWSSKVTCMRGWI